MTLLTRTIRKEVQPLHEAGVRLHYIGRLDVLNDASAARSKRRSRSPATTTR